MWTSKNLTCLLFALLVSIQLDAIQCSPTNYTVTFEAFRTVKVKSVERSELNCKSRKLFQNLCSNITEVTCIEQRPKNQIKLCSVSNKDSVFYKQLVESKLVCNDNNLTLKGNCLLEFKPIFEQDLFLTMYFKVVGYDKNGLPITKLVSEFDDKNEEEMPKKIKNTEESFGNNMFHLYNVVIVIILVLFGFTFGCWFILIWAACCRRLCVMCCIEDPSRTPGNMTVSPSASHGRSNTTSHLQNVNHNNDDESIFDDPPPKYAEMDFRCTELPSYSECLGVVNPSYVEDSKDPK